MTTQPYANIEKGTLLIASPDVSEDLYRQSVILICEYTPVGSFGLILNKPFNLDLPEAIQGLEEIANPKVHLRVGGGMQQTQMMLLHSYDKSNEQTLKVLDNVYLGGDLNLLSEMLNDESNPEILLCFGYTGWTTGEIEKQFMNGLWHLYPGSQELIFRTPPEKLWRTVLTSMGGKYSGLSLMPEDLTLN